jgi:hypothetical protein
MVPHACELTRVEFFPKDLEHTSGNRQWIHRKSLWEFLRDVVREILNAPLFGWGFRDVPAFIIDTAYQDWKLRT